MPVKTQPGTTNATIGQVTKIFVSLELSQTKWVITSMSPGKGGRMSRHTVNAGDWAGLLSWLAKLQAEARRKTNAEHDYPIVVIYEAGLDGFWIARDLTREGVTVHVVDPASVPVPRRHRQLKTDRIDGEALLRTLLAYERGEPRVCSMVHIPSVEEEDERHISRAYEKLSKERNAHTNYIKGMLTNQGIRDYVPINKNRRRRFEELRKPDGSELPPNLKDAICDVLDRLELVLKQMEELEVKRDALIEAKAATATAAGGNPAPVKMLLTLKWIGAQTASVLWHECFVRHFDNRRELASFAGVSPTPWKSGSINRVQGVSGSGNPRVRKPLLQLAWRWVNNQKESAITKWYWDRLQENGGRTKRTLIVAVARKLLIALWRYAMHGVVIEGAV